MTDEQKEQTWLDGNRAAYRAILLECARHLGVDDPLAKAAELVAERQDAIIALRRVCEDLGLDNDWPDDLHLADIIEKHVHRSVADWSES